MSALAGFGSSQSIYSGRQVCGRCSGSATESAIAVLNVRPKAQPKTTGSLNVDLASSLSRTHGDESDPHWCRVRKSSRDYSTSDIYHTDDAACDAFCGMLLISALFDGLIFQRQLTEEPPAQARRA
jgi:hypothetical protein